MQLTVNQKSIRRKPNPSLSHRCWARLHHRLNPHLDCVLKAVNVVASCGRGRGKSLFFRHIHTALEGGNILTRLLLRYFKFRESGLKSGVLSESFQRCRRSRTFVTANFLSRRSDMNAGTAGMKNTLPLLTCTACAPKQTFISSQSQSVI